MPLMIRRIDNSDNAMLQKAFKQAQKKGPYTLHMGEDCWDPDQMFLISGTHSDVQKFVHLLWGYEGGDPEADGLQEMDQINDLVGDNWKWHNIQDMIKNIPEPTVLQRNGDALLEPDAPLWDMLLCREFTQEILDGIRAYNDSNSADYPMEISPDEIEKERADREARESRTGIYTPQPMDSDVWKEFLDRFRK